MPLQNVFPLILVLIAGMIVPPAVAMNSTLGRMLKAPVLGACVVMFVGGIFVSILSLMMRSTLPSANDLAKIPWFAWLGGVLISLYMVLMNYNVPKIGVGIATCLVVAGQLITGLAIDHFGLFGLPQTSFSVGRFFGFLTIVIGVLLVKFF
jgi:transporter family-2 protein